MAIGRRGVELQASCECPPAISRGERPTSADGKRGHLSLSVSYTLAQTSKGTETDILPNGTADNLTLGLPIPKCPHRERKAEKKIRCIAVFG